MPTEQEVQALADAMWQLLDDMQRGVNVSLGAKIEARIAFEPFRDKSEPEYPEWLSFVEATSLRASAERYR